jgi:hypothetical protein
MSDQSGLEAVNTHRTEARAVGSLLRQAKRVADRKTTSNSPGVKRVMAKFTFVEQLRAFELVQARQYSNSISWSECHAASIIVQGRMLALSDKECIAGLASYAERFPDNVRHVANAIFVNVRPWPENFLDRPSLMVLSARAYDGLCDFEISYWAEYMERQLARPHNALSAAQRTLGRVLSDEWTSSGRSLLETVRALGV